MPHPDELRDLTRQKAEQAVKEAEDTRKKKEELGEIKYEGGAAPSAVPNHPKDPLLPAMVGGEAAYPQPKNEGELKQQSKSKLERTEAKVEAVPGHVRERNEKTTPVKDGKANPEASKKLPDAAELSKKDAESKK